MGRHTYSIFFFFFKGSLCQSEAQKTQSDPDNLSLFSCEEAALEATFKLVNQSKSAMSCNGRHGDKKLVNKSKSVM